MIYNKKINTFYKLGNIKLEEGKVFNKRYNKQYNQRKNIARDHFLLTNAFNITKLIKKNNNDSNNYNNNDIIPENYYFEEDKKRFKLNIYNYQKTLGNLKNNDYNTNEDDLLMTLLNKIDSKNIEEIIKERERMLNLQRKTLRGISHKLEPLTYNNTKWETFNKTNSLKSISNINNRSNYKTIESNFNSASIIFKNNNSLSIDTMSPNSHKDSYIRNCPFQKRYHSQTLNQKLKGIFKAINTEEKIAEKNMNNLNSKKHLNYYRKFMSNKFTLKAKLINGEQMRKKHNLIKDVEKIKRKKDIDKILFRQDRFVFKDIKNKLHSLYKKGKKIPSKYFDE